METVEIVSIGDDTTAGLYCAVHAVKPEAGPIDPSFRPRVLCFVRLVTGQVVPQ